MAAGHKRRRKRLRQKRLAPRQNIWVDPKPKTKSKSKSKPVVKPEEEKVFKEPVRKTKSKSKSKTIPKPKVTTKQRTKKKTG